MPNDSSGPARPIPDSYWVRPHALLAGEYPGARDTVVARSKLQRLLKAGVTRFVDLTEAGEYGLKPYWPLVQQLVPAGNVQHIRRPIRDMGTPQPEELAQTLDTMNDLLGQGEVVYVHCWGGIGRTGLVVACYLVEQGLTGDEALARIADWRAGTPDAHRLSPETVAQRTMVHTWSRSSGTAFGIAHQP